ncbi:unnamed protein product, partial [Phaeothamnion confervicola]
MSLVETIYATLLLGFIALFLLNLYPSSFVAIKRGESTFTADNFASSILEDLHSRSYGNVTPANVPAYQKQTFGGIEYTPVVQIVYLPNDPNLLYTPDPNHVKSASVTVSWYYSN